MVILDLKIKNTTTAPINKKQEKVGMKYLAKILWESSL